MAGAKKSAAAKLRFEDAERKFWAEHDSTEFIDWTQARLRKFPKLKPTPLTKLRRLPVSGA